jgi:putative membrane protein
MLAIAAVPTVLYALGWTFIALPWQPVAIVGTAVAFIVGFKNNASYNRVWEARQIYGGIINNSRSFAYSLRDALGGKESEDVKRIFYRHFAWLTALRYQLREPRPWENTHAVNNDEFRNDRFCIPETVTTIAEELKQYLSETEHTYILTKKNKAAQLTALQSEDLAKLKATGKINDFQWTLLQNSLINLTDDQGKAERIKNFPYPRNFSSIATFLLLIFITLAPFALVGEMERLGKGSAIEGWSIWLNIPFSALICWAFHTLDGVGESSVNPFEGTANDVPITQISRNIEIDLRDMLDEAVLPEPLMPKRNIVL